jgi:hypothetical protein
MKKVTALALIAAIVLLGAVAVFNFETVSIEFNLRVRRRLA